MAIRLRNAAVDPCDDCSSGQTDPLKYIVLQGPLTRGKYIARQLLCTLPTPPRKLVNSNSIVHHGHATRLARQGRQCLADDRRHPRGAAVGARAHDLVRGHRQE